ncbi:Ankyrin repeat-containing protein [Cladophialophora immunda]|nr:Ankyrin repeat-containing protein [Cladophialophora immunda]
MSFGFSIGDFLAVAKTRTLQIVLTDLRIQVEDDELTDSIKNDLQSAKKNCEAVLRDLNAVIDAHTELDSATAVPRKVPQRIWKRLRWDPKEANQLRSRLTSSIQLLAAVRQSLDSTLQHDVAQNLARLTATHDNKEVRQIADWLAPGTYSEHQHDYFTRVQAGTGQWVFTDPLYCSWLRGGGPSTLLLPGIPGAGKTFVASIIINWLQARVSHDDTSGLVFFYNSFQRTATQSCRHIVASMVRQLYLQKPHKNDVVKSVYEEHIKRGLATLPSLEELCTTLEKLLAGFSVVFFVIDALDECQGPEASDARPWKYILTFLFRLQEQLKSQVAIKVLATSRPDLEIDGHFPNDGRLTIHARNDDLGKFCDSLIPNIGCIARKTELHPKIKDAICDSARGMFLLAKLHCDTLAAKTKPKDVLKALNTFAQGGDALNRAYQDTIQRIQCQPEEHKALAKKVLVCVTHSARPLTLDEIRHALAVDQETTELDPEYDLDNPDDVISSCAGLVTIDSESRIIRLVHYTTQSFLESLGDELMPDPHDFLATCCLDYLHLDVFAEGHLVDNSYFRHRQEFPFFQYSAKYWHWHILSGSGNIFLKQRAFSFLDNNGRVATATRCLSNDAWDIHGECALHFLAFQGLNDWITDYIGRGPVTEGNWDGKGSCPDCRTSSTEIRHRLSNNTTSWITLLTSWCDSRGRTPLWYAIRKRHASTARLLIDLNNEIIDKVDDEGQTPLNLALVYKVEAVALRILEEPKRVSWYQYRDRDDSSYLHNAVSYGHEAVVDRLLELVSAFDTSGTRSIAISYTTSQEKFRDTPVHDAAGAGHLGIVEKLLACSGGRGLNLRTRIGHTPLISAAKGGHLEVVQYLMSQDGIQADFRDRHGMSALHWAAACGTVPVLEYLLSTGLFPANSTSTSGRTALHYASVHHKRAVVSLTSREDVGVNCTDKDGRNALMVAAQYASADVIAHLAPLMRDVNSTDADGDIALHHLCKSRYWAYRPEGGSKAQASFDSLVKNGASLDITNKQGQTPYEALCLRMEGLDATNDRKELESLETLKRMTESYMSVSTEA